MSKHAIVPLESYRLAQYSVPIPCYICEADNTYEAEFCTHCQAPLALAHQASIQKVQPQMAAVLGSSGVGKTVYLGMLADMLTREEKGMQILLRGAFSISLQQQTLGALSRCQFPHKTPNEPDRWNWIHAEITSHGRRPIELIMPDLAGESLITEIDHPHTYPVVRSFLKKCNGVLLLVDVERLESGDQEPDFHGMKILTYLSELHAKDKRGWGKRPISVVLSKADACEDCFIDPLNYARRKTPGIWRIATERISQASFFACSVAGATVDRIELGVRTSIPLRIEPRGIVEPFRWLMNKLPGNKS